MEFEDFKAQGFRVTQEFHDQYLSEMADPRLKESPPFPFLRWVSYPDFVASQISFTGNVPN
jgi:hypothetical protein